MLDARRLEVYSAVFSKDKIQIRDTRAEVLDDHSFTNYLNEHTIYLADSINAPYGPKGKERITELCIKNVEFLMARDCKLIVVACNTATTNAIKYLRKNYNIPLIGIEPAIKPAALQSKTKAIGILATKGTLASELFYKTIDLYRIEPSKRGFFFLGQNQALSPYFFFCKKNPHETKGNK